VKLLLDTCSFLWAVNEPSRLSRNAFGLIEDPDNELFVSSVSAFEIAVKGKDRRFPLAVNPEIEVPRLRAELGAATLLLTEEAALYAFNLPPLHRDPFDRLLISQAIVEGLVLVTPDRNIHNYAVRVFW
jgi:PIN domain nuclease of toxin-antitoxin system